MTELFVEHANELISPEEKEKAFLSNRKIIELFDIHDKTSRSDSLRVQVREGYMAGTQLKILRQKKFGTSPIISANMVLANCYYQRLAPFFWKDAFWTEEDESPTD